MKSPAIQATLAATIGAALFAYHRGPITAAFAAVLLTFALLAWLAPRAYAPIARGLDCLAHALAAAVTWLTLGAIYLGVFVPLRLFNTALRRDPLRLRFDPTADSYLTRLPARPTDHFTRPF